MLPSVDEMPDARKLHVLLMEDDEGMKILAQRRFDSTSIVPTFVSDGHAGLKLLEANSYDAVVIDYNMPLLNGLKVLERIRTLSPTLPTIMLTGMGSEQLAVEAMRLGANDYLIKDTSLVYLQILPSAIRKVISEAEARRAHQQAQLALLFEQERARILAQFIQDASHEFRTPLSVIISSCELLARTGTSDKQHGYLNRIQEQAFGISRLIDDLVAQVQLDAISELPLMPMNLTSLLHGQLDSWQSRIEAEGKHLTVNLSDARIIVQCDHARLNTLFDELLENALAYAEPGSRVEVTLAVDTSEAGSRARIDIHDEGGGMSGEQLASIWNRFYRGDPARTTSGFGLGLPICKRIVELHHGEIQIESAVGHGTTVTIWLPCI